MAAMMGKLQNARKPLIALLLLFATAISADSILSQTGEVPSWPWDQSFVKRADLTARYPRLQNTGGITASLLVGLYKLIIPTTPKTLDYHIKIFAMILMFFSGFLMAKQYLRTDIGLIVFVLIMVTPGYQFVELSHETIAAAFLFLFLYGFAKVWHPAILSLLLVSFGLSKAELGVAALSMLVYWIWTESSPGKKMLIGSSFAVWMLVFLSPALYLYGESAVLGNKALCAFVHHYCIRFNPHQFIPSNPWGSLPEMLRVTFPGAESLYDVVVLYPRKYLDYAALSCVNAVITMVLLFKGLLLAFACRQQSDGRSQSLRSLESLFFILFIASMLPLTLISSPHAGYFPKFHMPLAVLCISYWEDCSSGHTKAGLRMKYLIFTAFFLTIIWQCMWLLDS